MRRLRVIWSVTATVVAAISVASASNDIPESAWLTVQTSAVMASGKPVVVLDVVFPKGYKHYGEATLKYSVLADTGGALEQVSQGEFKRAPVRVTLPADKIGKASRVEIRSEFYYCSMGDTGVCAVQPVRARVPVGGKKPAETVTATFNLPDPTEENQSREM